MCEPSLTQEQASLLQIEMDRILKTYHRFVEQSPLDFALQSSSDKRRQYIPLMKDICLSNQAAVEISDDHNFLDYVFGLGEVTEVCGLSACGKSQICF